MASKTRKWKVVTIQQFLEKHYSLEMQITKFEYPLGCAPGNNFYHLSLESYKGIAKRLRVDPYVLMIKAMRESGARHLVDKEVINEKILSKSADQEPELFELEKQAK